MFSSRRSVTFKYEDVPDLNGQAAVITGASRGLGKATLSALAKKGAHVICIGRNPEKTKAAISEVVQLTGNLKVDYIEAHLTDLKSADKAATSFLAMDLLLHMLILNGGIMSPPTFRLNHFAHVLLIGRFLPVIERTTLAGQPVPVVAVSSTGNIFAPKEGIITDKLNDKDSYAALTRYGETKLANIIAMKELQQRLQKKHGNDVPIYCNSLNPGNVRTELTRSVVPPSLAAVVDLGSKMFLLTPEQDAISSVYLATSPGVVAQSIRGQFYWDQSRTSLPSELHQKADDKELWTTVWEWSEHILKEKLETVPTNEGNETIGSTALGSPELQGRSASTTVPSS
ncbi:NAD(P)-binding protein [Gonapodya prolifera JEL478]|uniref:NAD(P)-binding protein n=1 Tax=Gonapodya prolifera (strain JEL478) TaxID=1344416 RepID=A0A139APM9_GONPJ|nr:NAD(P)-binding protein [Gonapodya prolifera JEL478]|eukprot:KXS18711.1 NAD(P)-binding protein [Gonapodya prolifera JEL478]